MNKEIPLTILGISFLGLVSTGGIYAIVLCFGTLAAAFWFKIKSDEQTLPNKINKPNTSKLLS